MTATKTSKKSSKAAAKKSDRVIEMGAEKTHDVPWSEKKVKVLTALRKLGEATSTQIAEKAGVTQRDARHYCYHAAAGGIAKFEHVEGEENKWYFKLTAKGEKMDFAAEFKAQQAAKAAKKSAPKAKTAKAPKAKAKVAAKAKTPKAKKAAPEVTSTEPTVAAATA